MQNATIANKESLLAYLDQTEFRTPKPDFTAGFAEINSVITASTADLCNGIIIFLSAGMNGDDLGGRITTFTSGLPSNYRLHSIALGGCSTNKHYAEKMSCDGSGFYFESEQTTDLLGNVRKFH